MPLVSYTEIVALLNIMVQDGRINAAQRQHYIDRLYADPGQGPLATPGEIWEELAAIKAGGQTIPGNGSGGGSGSNADPIDYIDDPEGSQPFVGVLEMPMLIGAAALVPLALRLTPFLVRLGSRLTIPVRMWNSIDPLLRNSLYALSVGAADVAEELVPEIIDDLLRGRGQNETVVEITGTPQQLLQLEGGNGMNGLTLVPGLGNLPPGVWIVKWWRAPRDGGVLFYKFSNGLIAVQKLDGTWKVYRPRKPIVLYAGVGNNRRSIMRAAHVVRGEVKAWKSMEKFFGMQRRRALPAPKRAKTVIVEHGSGSVIAD